MKIYNIAFILILISFIASGCSKTTISSNLGDLETKKSTVENSAPQEESGYNDDFEDISPYAYNHYVAALLLESENPPDIVAAGEHYKLALQEYPHSHHLLYSLARTYMSLRMYNDALVLLERIKPADKKVLQMEGNAYLQVGKQDSAKYKFEKLAQIAPNEPTSYHYLSSFYKYTNNNDSLIWAYENLSRLLPFNETYWQELGKLKAQKGKYEEAKIAFSTSLEKNNSISNLLSYVGLAEMYKIENKPDSVIYTYQNALKIDSTNAALYTDITMMYAQLDSLEQSIPYAVNAVRYNPENLQNLRRLGIIYFGTQRYDSSETIFTEIVNRGDQNFLNHFYLGRIAAQQDNYNIAVEEFKIMVQLNDSIPEHWLDLGYAYKKLDDFTNETATYREGALKVSDKNGKVKLLFSLGAAFERNKMVDSAISVFEEILTIDPEHHQTMNFLGYMLTESEMQLSYAKDLIKKAMKLSPNNAAYIDSYGWLMYKEKKYKDAVKHLKIAAELKEDPVVYEHLGDAYKANGDESKALDWWGKALKLNPENEDIINKMK